MQIMSADARGTMAHTVEQGCANVCYVTGFFYANCFYRWRKLGESKASVPALACIQTVIGEEIAQDVLWCSKQHEEHKILLWWAMIIQ